MRTEALKYYRRVADHYKLNIRQYETCRPITGEDGAFVTYATDRSRLPRTVRVEESDLSPRATTTCPNRLNVPGEDLPKVIHYYKEPHPYYNHDVAGRRREELRRHRGSGIVVDRSARHADSSRRRHLTRT